MESTGDSSYYYLQPPQPQHDLLDILNSWNMGFLFQQFIDMGIDAESLKFIQKEDLSTMFTSQQFGVKVKFRAKLKEWQINNGIDFMVDDIEYLKNISNWITKFGDDHFPNIGTRSPTGSNSTVASPLPSPSSTATMTSQWNNSFDINSYLLTNGRDIEDASRKNSGNISAPLREKLITDIVNHYISNKIFMHDSEFTNVTNQILRRFPGEESHFYFCNKGVTRTGRIYSRYRNCVFALRKQGLFPLEKQPKKRKINETPEPTEEGEVLELDCREENQTWLNVYSEPWDTVLSKWVDTTGARFTQIKTAGRYFAKILEAWSKYNHAQGAQLIDIDFEHLFPGRGNELFLKWDQFCADVVPIFRSSVKDKLNSTLIGGIEKQINKDLKDFEVLKILHAVLVPSGFVKDKDKHIWKFSIADSQASFIKLIYSITDLKTEQNKRFEQYAKFGMTCQPCIYILKLDSEYEFYCTYESITYKLNSLLSAVSTAFKIHFVFDLKYQLESKLLWQFIQQYFFGINLEITPTAVAGLLLQLKN